MEVTIPGNLITILKDDGTEQIINGLTIVDEGAIKWFQYNTVPVAQTSDQFTQPTPTSVTRYKVVVHFNDNRFETIYMGEVTNQAGWTDDLTGANQAVADLSAAMVSSGGGGGGSVSAVTASSPLASSGGTNPNITFVGPITSDSVTDESDIGGGAQTVTTSLNDLLAYVNTIPTTPVTDVTASAPLASTGGQTPDISFVGPIASDDVTNNSTISGTTVTDALNALSGSAGYLVLEGTITQTGTHDPVITELANTLGAAYVATRTGVGTYQINCAAFAANRTSSWLGPIGPFEAIANGNVVEMAGIAGVVGISSGNIRTGVAADDLLSDTYFRITVKP